jgi:hypothetical protein
VCSAAEYDNGAWNDVTGHMCSVLFAALALVVAPPSHRGGLSADVPPMVVCLFSAYCWGARRGREGGGCRCQQLLHALYAAHNVGCFFMCSMHITQHMQRAASHSHTHKRKRSSMFRRLTPIQNAPLGTHLLQ